MEANLFIDKGPDLSKITNWVNSSNKSTEIINSFSSSLSIAGFSKLAIQLWVIWIEQISKSAFFIESIIISTFFFGKDVKKYLLQVFFLNSFLGRFVKLISKSEFSKDIGIWIPESGSSKKLLESFSFTSSGISTNLV